MRYSRIKRASANEVGRKYGFRSGLERKVQQQLIDLGVTFEYEEHTVRYTKPETKHKYTPDFVLPNHIIVETKGLFNSDDRKKIKLVLSQHPDLDLRFVFSNPNSRISKTSKTTYAMWCDKEDIPYAKAVIPEEWIVEPPCAMRRVALQKATNG